METIYARNFLFDNSKCIWKNVYKQKVVNICMLKLKEFNFKILQNIVPCGRYLNKWKHNIDGNCKFCNMLETTEHMLYNCSRVNNLWEKVSNVLKCNIKWKHIVCGWPMLDCTNQKIRVLKIIITIVTYSIF